MLRFGGLTASEILVDFAYRSAQSLVLGKLASTTEVGIYNRGQSLFQRPFDQIMGPTMAVMLPTLSARQHDGQSVGRFVARTNWFLAISLLPLVVWMASSGPDLGSLLLGSQWREAGETMSWLAIAALPTCLFAALGRANAAMNRPARTLKLNLLVLPVYIAGTLWAAPHGASAVAMVYAIMQIARLPFVLWWLLSDITIPARHLLLQMLLSLIPVVVTGFLLYMLPSQPFFAGPHGEAGTVAAFVWLGIKLWLAYVLIIIFALLSAEGRSMLQELSKRTFLSIRRQFSAVQ